jgi:cyclophilin family peptidyl-prolyl cis-trans isomerase
MANTGSADSGGGQWFIITGDQGVALPPSYSILGTVTKGFDTTVQALENLADPLAQNGVPPLAEIVIESITITQS